MNTLPSSIYGQDLNDLERCIRRAAFMLSPPGRPLGSFLLAGPTGVGKTETVHQVADHLHNDPSLVLTINCSEYQLPHEVAKLIGSPPGYLGHRETPPILSPQNLVKVTSSRCPISLILFDEIEKADPALFKITLSMLDKGNLALGSGESVRFDRSMIFFTTNLGNHDRNNNHDLLPSRNESYAPKATELAIRKFFSPEWLNRLTTIIYYKPLDQSSLDKIIDRRIGYLEYLLDQRTPATSISITLPYLARQELIRQTVSIRYGARELIRRLDNLILDHVADWMESYKPSSRFAATVGNQQEQHNLHLVVNPDLTVNNMKTKTMSRGQ